jgi:hypothetical protein
LPCIGQKIVIWGWTVYLLSKWSNQLNKFRRPTTKCTYVLLIHANWRVKLYSDIWLYLPIPVYLCDSKKSATFISVHHLCWSGIVQLNNTNHDDVLFYFTFPFPICSIDYYSCLTPINIGWNKQSYSGCFIFEIYMHNIISSTAIWRIIIFEHTIENIALVIYLYKYSYVYTPLLYNPNISINKLFVH